jgi:tetratricopeptide (TPR) repeat protein
MYARKVRAIQCNGPAHFDVINQRQGENMRRIPTDSGKGNHGLPEAAAPRGSGAPAAGNQAEARGTSDANASTINQRWVPLSESRKVIPAREAQRGMRDIVLHRGPQGKLGMSVAVRNSAGPGPYRILGLETGSAAETSGLLQQDDLIHAIDHVHIGNIPFDQVAKLLRGNPGSSLVLTIERPDASSQPSRTARESHAPSYTSNPSLLEAHQHAQQPSDASSRAPPARYSAQQTLAGERDQRLEPVQTGSMQSPLPPPLPPRQTHLPAPSNQHMLGVPDAAKQYKVVYDTRQVAFSPAQQTLISDFKHTIETSNTLGLINLHQEILNLAESVHVQAPYASMGIYAKLGFAYNSLPCLDSFQYERAIQVLEKANNIAQKQQDNVTQGAIYYQLGLAHAYLKRYDEALKWFGHYLAFALNNNHEDGEVEGYLKLAEVSQKLSNHAQAVEWYSRALETIQKGKDTSRLGRIRQQIGLSHEALSNYSQALLSHRAHFDQTEHGHPEQVLG